MVRLRDVMTADPFCVSGDATLPECADVMVSEGIRHLVVIDDAERLTGVIYDGRLFGELRSVDGEWTLRAEGWDLRAEDVMEPAMLTAFPDDPLVDVLTGLARSRSTDVIIVVDGERRPVGVFTEHDAVVLAADRIPAESVPRHLVSREVVTQTVDDTISAARWVMAMQGTRHLLVVGHKGELVGVISRRDLEELGVDADPHQALREVIAGRTMVTVPEDASTSQVIDRMVRQRIGCLPVVGPRGHAAYVITRTDVMWALVDALNDDGLFPDEPVAAGG